MTTHDNETRTIDITPSDEGMAAYTEVFLDNILGDVPKRRKGPSADLLVSVIEQVLYLNAKGRFDLVANILNHAAADAASPTRYIGTRRTETEAGSLSRT